MNYLEIEREMTKTYNAIATRYEKEAQEDWKDKKYVDNFLNYIHKNDSILDIACGTGELLKYYNDKGFRTTGIDISEEMVNISKTKIPNPKVINMSLYDIDKLQEKFDAISATFTLVHIPKEKINEFIKKVSERLNEDGIFFTVFTTSLQEGIQEEQLDRNYKYYAVNYSTEEISTLLIYNGFEILEDIEATRINKSDVGIIVARKLK